MHAHMNVMRLNHYELLIFIAGFFKWRSM